MIKIIIGSDQIGSESPMIVATVFAVPISFKTAPRLQARVNIITAGSIDLTPPSHDLTQVRDFLFKK